MKQKLKWILPLAGLAALVLWFVAVPLLPSAVTGTEWHLVSVQGVGDATLWVSDDADQFTMEFSWRTISGRGSCNAYEGRYRLNQFTRSFSTSRVFHTMIGCLGDEALAHEVDFFQALDTASRYELREGELHIYFDNATQELVFAPE